MFCCDIALQYPVDLAVGIVGLMASANLDLVRSIFVGWEQGDFSSTWWAHPEIELVLVGGPERGTFSGLAGMAAGWREFLRTWEDLRAVPDQYLELDEDRVLVILHNSGRGKTSGLEVGSIRQRSANLFEIEDGKVKRLVAYWDADPALADAGLAEDD
jgi:ketosteroid isomerase-like protein